MPGAIKVNINFYRISSFLLIVFSGFFLTRLLPVSPIYLAMLVGMGGVFVAISMKAMVKYTNIIVTPYLFLLYLCLTQVFLAPMIGTFFNVVISLTYLIMLPLMLPGLSREALVKIAIAFIKFSVILLVVEGAYRVTHPIFQMEDSTVDYSSSEDLLFYAYKMNSIMFQDSNFVGLYGLSVFFLGHYINKFHKKINKLWLIVLAITIVGTLSRADIISMVLTLMLIWMVGYRLPLQRILILSVLGLVMVGFAVHELINDPSLQSKFDIIYLARQYLKNASVFNLIFGAGLGNTKKHLAIGAHNFFVTYIIETGIIGMILEICILVELFIKSKTKAWPLLASFLVAGLSLASHVVTYLYASVFLVICLENKLREEAAQRRQLSQPQL